MKAFFSKKEQIKISIINPEKKLVKNMLIMIDYIKNRERISNYKGYYVMENIWYITSFFAPVSLVLLEAILLATPEMFKDMFKINVLYSIIPFILFFCLSFYSSLKKLFMYYHMKYDEKIQRMNNVDLCNIEPAYFPDYERRKILKIMNVENDKVSSLVEEETTNKQNNQKRRRL